MSKKTSSFIFPFSVAFAVSLVAGLTVMYFGFYRAPIQQYLSASTSAASTRTPPSERTGDILMETGTDSPGRAQPPEKKPNRGSTDSSSGEKTTTQRNPVTDSGVSPRERTFGAQENTAGTRPKKERSTAGSEESGETETFQRQPAFPRSDSGVSDTSVENTADPDENPLMKALREAGKRSQTPRANTGDPPPNPFEQILNNRAETE